MSQEDGRCPLCNGSLDPSSATCPSCRRSIFESHVDDFGGDKICPKPASIALTPRNLMIGGAALLLIVAGPIIAFLSLSRTASHQPLPAPIVKTVVVHDRPVVVPSLPPAPPTAGTVVCKADWSSGMNGWVGSSEWKVLGGKLLSDGANLGPGSDVAPTGSDSVSSPCQPVTRDYAVEAKMQISDTPANCYLAIRGRLQPDDAGYGGYFVGFDSYFGDAYIGSFSPLAGFLPLRNTFYNPALTEHLYRAEFRGNQITLKIDNHIMLQVIDNKFINRGQVGLESGGCQVSVSSFQVVAL